MKSIIAKVNKSFSKYGIIGKGLIKLHLKKRKITGTEAYALREFKNVGWIDELGNYDCNTQEMMCKDILALLRMLDDQNHSGSSFRYLYKNFIRLADFKPIAPLTGEDDEWEEEGLYLPDEVEGKRHLYQNKRCGSVWKDENGNAHLSDANCFRYPDGTITTAGEYSDVNIDFPFEVPDKPNYIDVDEEGSIVIDY